MFTQPFQQTLQTLFSELQPMTDGAVATYIPELAKADPDHLAIAIATVDGVVHTIGDSAVPFTMQSLSKPFAYAAALDRLGRAEMVKRVGVEPTGEAFNAIVLDTENNRPFNPMVNAGAIAISALFDGETMEARAEAMTAALSRFAGRRLHVDEVVRESEAATGHRNRAIAYLMLNSGMLAAEPDVALDTYFRQCSLSATTRDLAVMAATLANDGINPVTGERAMEGRHVADVLTVMLTCGMYDYAGQWAFEIGLPAKSGVSGGVIAVVPGQFGIAVYSPRLDRYGNSVRGVAACRRLSGPLALHAFRTRPDTGGAIRREMTGRFVRSKRQRSAEELAILDAEGDSILVVETRGDVFVGAGERMLRRIGAALGSGRQVILDLKRVTNVDPGAEVLIRDHLRLLARAGQSVILAHHRESGLADRLDLLRQRDEGGFVLAETLDAALEIAEERILAGRRPQATADELALAAVPLLAGLDAEDLAVFLDVIRPERCTYCAGDVIVRQGDRADCVHVVVSGAIRVQLPAPGNSPLRLASLGPGATFGEMALIEPQPRSADVVAEEDTVTWALSIERFAGLSASHPKIMNRILSRLVVDLADRLRRANATVLALSS